jgi:hypothetical protein
MGQTRCLELLYRMLYGARQRYGEMRHEEMRHGKMRRFWASSLIGLAVINGADWTSMAR